MESIYKLLKIIPLKMRLKIFYFFKFRKILDIKKPKKYTEKIQYRKLNMLSSYSVLSDKLLVKNYISKLIGKEYIIKTIYHTTNVDDINFNKLPDSFVIKTNFGSGAEHIHIIKDKNKIDENSIKKKFQKALSKKYKGSILGETQYDKINKKILIEEFIDNNGNDIDDFKFHIFNSKNGFLQIDFDRFSDHKRNLYNLNFEKLNYGLCYKQGDYTLPPLELLEKMKNISLTLSQNFDYVRIDLYLVKDKIFFGEMTFTPGSGFEAFSNSYADELYGKLWLQE
ncbi:hypothetical protein BBX45_03625 [Proteus mirabilis]|uniref:ATP-grasp fold amidoligase family protein n=1 Tax=Proteus mirabilis TaxID=584 RepID=UPI0008DCD8E0|nr:ATP-grasp fold amidoligase family protein [Proteus mirabilis]MBG3116099.1 hypothetical protein [Proteus mirabilis]MDM3574840.1 ATP-grasp fold amidoligase family protein [Proteus mirabilis]MDZ7490044.1 ATP-grasp fold amidoligase family protein [Proteus mirabilis]OHY45287.1 hypothetical protein BBX45_03625 [Proteus mirabilis]